MDDVELLCRYAETADQAAFAELVARRLPLVYSTALRQVAGDAHLARDVAQVVFADLARKARALAGHRVLAGWLYTSTCYAAAKIVRAEQRRRSREREAHALNEILQDDQRPADWSALRPVIDEVMQELNERDREAVLLRFFENRAFGEIGERLRVGENGARMRVERALDKLHAGLAKRGIGSSAAALGAALAAHAVGAAPSGMATAIAAAVPLAGPAASGWGLLMGFTKLQWATGAAVVAMGTLTAVVQYRANSALERDVVRLEAATEEIRSDRERLRAASEGSDEWDRLRQDAAELPDAQARLKARLEELDQRQLGRETGLGEKAKLAARPAVGSVLDGKELDVAPKPLKQTPPLYPAGMRQFGISGRATVSFVIDAEGKVAEAKVVKSTHSAFEEPALAALAEWRFAPGQKDGVPVNTRVEMAMLFTLNNTVEGWF